MQRTGGTAVKMLLKQNGIHVDENTDLDEVAIQLEEEAKNIKIRINSLTNRHGLINNMLGAVNAYKVQQGINLEDLNAVDSSKTVIPT